MIFVVLKKKYCGIDKNTVCFTEDELSESKTCELISFDGCSIKDVPTSLLKEVDLITTGDRHKRKMCNVCHRLLPVSLFQKNRYNKKEIIRRPTCNGCRKIMEGKGISASDRNKFEEIKPKDGTVWTCPLCKKTNVVGVTVKVVLDHDHKTGKPRQWICDSCNTGIGRFRDDPEIIKRAKEYLEAFAVKKRKK